jgi:hypothetical protein
VWYRTVAAAHVQTWTYHKACTAGTDRIRYDAAVLCLHLIVSTESAGATSNGDSPEPTMRDLRARIAKDLDMAEVIQLIEFLPYYVILTCARR